MNMKKTGKVIALIGATAALVTSLIKDKTKKDTSESK